MLSNIFIHPMIVLIALTTASSVIIHDTRLDKMAVTALSAPSSGPTYEAGNVKTINLSGEAHTHTERNSLSQVINDLKAPNPRQQPRSDDRKHLMQKHVTKGQHYFDNYYLPL